jgi:hypothetical protein
MPFSCFTLRISKEDAARQYTDRFTICHDLFINMNLVYFFLAAEVLKLALDAAPSANNEHMWDTPAAAVTWLKTFAVNNETLLKETDVCFISKILV